MELPNRWLPVFHMSVLLSKWYLISALHLCALESLAGWCAQMSQSFCTLLHHWFATTMQMCDPLHVAAFTRCYASLIVRTLCSHQLFRQCNNHCS
jgi:hypothetical protein